MDGRMPGQPQISIIGLGLACCAVEYHAAWQHEQVRQAAETALGGIDADVLVLAGTITTALAPTVLAAYDAMRPRRAVIAFGACTISGGPYWDSYSVLPGAPVPVDVNVPGCPPPPEALALGFAHLREVLAMRVDS